MLQAFIRLRALHTLFDATAGNLEKALGVPVCIPKCGLCCTDNCPTCMLIEGANMVSHLTGSGQLKKALAMAEDWLLTKHSEAKIYRGMPVGFVPMDIKAEWMALSKTRCPFLTDKLKCFIHSCRPLVCRAYGVTRDVEGCPRPLGKNESLTSRGVIDSVEIRHLVQEFKDGCYEQYPEWTIKAFSAVALFRAAYPEKFKGYVDDNRIASAKILGSEMDFALMWQPQIDALRSGKSPDLVAFAYNNNVQDPDALLAGLR